MHPTNLLATVKALLRAGNYEVDTDTLQDAKDDFEWEKADIVKCLLRLNDRPHVNDRSKNHFHKSVPHRVFPYTYMDYYKIKNATEGNEVYTHFYVRTEDGKLIIDSFKRLLI